MTTRAVSARWYATSPYSAEHSRHRRERRCRRPTSLSDFHYVPSLSNGELHARLLRCQPPRSGGSSGGSYLNGWRRRAPRSSAPSFGRLYTVIRWRSRTGGGLFTAHRKALIEARCSSQEGSSPEGSSTEREHSGRSLICSCIRELHSWRPFILLAGTRLLGRVPSTVRPLASLR